MARRIPKVLYVTSISMGLLLTGCATSEVRGPKNIGYVDAQQDFPSNERPVQTAGAGKAVSAAARAMWRALNRKKGGVRGPKKRLPSDSDGEDPPQDNNDKSNGKNNGKPTK